MKIFHMAGVNLIEPMHNPEPAWIISQCIAGNEEAIELLVRQYEAAIFGLALSIVGDPAEAREITQDTFISALRSLKTYQEQQSFKSWLYTIAINHSRSHLRKRKATERLRATLANILRLEVQKQVLPEEAFAQNEEEAILWKALNLLEERYRTVVVLRYFHEFSITEIAELLSIKEGTIHSRLYYAREKLRNSLNDLHGDQA